MILDILREITDIMSIFMIDKQVMIFLSFKILALFGIVSKEIWKKCTKKSKLNRK